MNQEFEHGKSPERRSAFRVLDAVGLEFVKLTADGVPDAEADSAPVADPGSMRVRVENKYDIEGFADVRRDYPAVAEYITSLEERIRTLLLDGEKTALRPTHRVSLSSSGMAFGMAFADQHVLQTGDVLQLQITLFPQVHTLVCEGTVVDVGVDTVVASGELHTYRIAFSKLSSEDREVIENHVETLRRIVRQPAGMNV